MWISAASGARMLGQGRDAIKPERADLKAAYDKAEQFGDYRKMLDTRKDIEAVLIATPDHHHAVAARMAMERGLHVFVQKPLTYTVRESRALTDIAKKTPGLITQMGNQGHSSDDGRRAVELLRGGAIGKVKEVHVWTNRPVWPQGVGKPEPKPVPAGPRLEYLAGAGQCGLGLSPRLCALQLARLGAVRHGRGGRHGRPPPRLPRLGARARPADAHRDAPLAVGRGHRPMGLQAA